MEQQPSHTQVNDGVTNGDAPAAYVATTYQPVALASVAPSAGATFPPASQGAPAYPVIPPQLSDQDQIAFQQVQQLHQRQQHQQEQLRALWADQMAEIEQTTEFKLHSLPLARIKKIMRADEDVKMIAGETPVVFAKACEMFILELTLRAWLHTEESKRRTLQRNDITAAITRAQTDMFDFLVDIIPTEELKGDGLGMPPSTPVAPAMVPSYAPGMVVPFGMYTNQQPVAFMWPLPEHQQQQQQTSDGGRDEQES